MGKVARFDYGVGFLPLLWEARPRGELLLKPGQACGPHSPRGRASYMGKVARFDYGAEFLPLLWEARPRGERLGAGAGLWPAFAAGTRPT